MTGHIKRIAAALRWTRSAWQRRYDAFVRQMAIRRWKQVFRGR